MPYSYGDDSPIAAFATTPGSGALALIRCSGRNAIGLAAKIFSASEKLARAEGNTVIHGWIVAPDAASTACAVDEKIDEVLVSVFRAPKSYTGEDSLDISCHGGLSAGRAILNTLRKAGFRDALPGEFTFRAFMNGKIDLTRSESVMELVCAKTDAGRRLAVGRLAGALENEINEIKKMLTAVLATAEIFLDYSEDEIDADADEAGGRLRASPRAKEALARLKKLSESWQRQRIYQEGILAVIAGRPNAGKSSLFNLLVKEERSIVTEVPGTTRDWIEAWVSIGGIPVRLADTAGLRESSDQIEKLGIQRSRELLGLADLALYLIDGAEGLTEEDRVFIERFTANGAGSTAKILVLWNKADIAPNRYNTAIGISAKTGEGVADLCGAIAAAVEQTAQTGNVDNGDDSIGNDNSQTDAALGSQRQKNLIEAAIAALEEALALAGRNEPLDLIAPLLREAVNSLGEITGEVSTADILEEMFGKFCVGK